MSKAFDCLDHDLLLAKLSAYGISIRSIKLLYSYLRNRKHRVRIGSHLSSWLEALLGVPQGSILGPLLFNIFINDLFYIIQDISNFADDNTLFSYEYSIDEVTSILVSRLELVLDWFKCNSMVANPSKFQLIFPGFPNANISLNIGNITIKSVETVKLLGVKIDSKLTFLPHVTELCKRSNHKLRALKRVRNFISQKQTELLVNAYILSPFNYCPLIWMFCGKQGNRLIDRCHFRALRALKNDRGKDYASLLLACNAVNIHTRNLKLLILETFKSLHCSGPPILQKIFSVNQTKHKLRSGLTLDFPSYKRYNSTFGVNTFDFRAVITWNRLPSSIKSIHDYNSFKEALQSISPNCTCKIHLILTLVLFSLLLFFMLFYRKLV